METPLVPTSSRHRGPWWWWCRGSSASGATSSLTSKDGPGTKVDLSSEPRFRKVADYCADDSLMDHAHNVFDEISMGIHGHGWLPGALVMLLPAVHVFMVPNCQSSLPRWITLVLVAALAGQGMCCQELEWWTHVSEDSSLLINMVRWHTVAHREKLRLADGSLGVMPACRLQVQRSASKTTTMSGENEDAFMDMLNLFGNNRKDEARATEDEGVCSL